MDCAELDQRIELLSAHKDEWAQLPVRRTMALLDDFRRKTEVVAEQWVRAEMKAKGTEDQPNLAWEEWLIGPWAVLLMANDLMTTLQYLEKGQTRPLKKVRSGPKGQAIVDVFPLTVYDRILFTGFRGEVWMQPGVTPSNLRESMAVAYRRSAPEGKVALVLGAGNAAFLSVHDALYKLYTERHVVLFKLNPVNEHLGIFYEEIFDSFCRAGYVQFAYGGSDVGAHLASHEGIDEIHLTGGARTHDAIVYGTGSEGAERKRQDQPINTKPITSELGCVTPTIVVPGPWSKAQLRYHAEHIATQKFGNAGHACLSTQVLITSQAWSQRQDLLDGIRQVVRAVPPRPSYYPGVANRHRSVVEASPQAEMLDAVASMGVGDGMLPRVLVSGVDYSAADNICFRQEMFCNILAETQLPGATPTEFLRNAVRFANERLDGTLSANLIVHPDTARELGPELDRAIAELRYGAIGVNMWAVDICLFPMFTWGAFPGHPRTDIQSGTGVVHNTFMFDRPEKSVLYAPFTVTPKPPFITRRNGEEYGKNLTAFEASRSAQRLPAVVWAAFRG